MTKELKCAHVVCAKWFKTQVFKTKPWEKGS